MEDKLELIYYQMLELENRLDKKIEYIKKCEDSLKEVLLKFENLKKSILEK